MFSLAYRILRFPQLSSPLLHLTSNPTVTENQSLDAHQIFTFMWENVSADKCCFPPELNMTAAERQPANKPKVYLTTFHM